MRACGSLAAPWTTLIRSNTTRRSAPMTRSRLRSPTSKSTTTTLFLARAKAAPSAAVDVVLPTPPLPDVTTITFPIFATSNAVSIHRCNHQCFAREPSLDRPLAQLGVEVHRGAVIAVDRHEFRFDAPAENPRPAVARCARQGAAAQGTVDVDATAGDDFGARADRAQHDHVAVRE